MQRFLWLIFAGTLGLLLLVGYRAFGACVEDPANGICCTPTPCQKTPGFVNYETNRDVRGALCGTDVYGGLVCEDTLTLRRAGFPTNPADPNHYAVWQPSDNAVTASGAAFAALTPLGKVELKLFRFRFYITQDTAKSYLAQPPPVALTKLWDCYATDNVTVTDPVTNKELGRQPVAWVDQIGPHDASVSKPSMVCVPGNAATTETFVCFGTMREAGPVPLPFKNPFLSVPPETAAPTGLLGRVEIKPPHEFCTTATVL